MDLRLISRLEKEEARERREETEQERVSKDQGRSRDLFMDEALFDALRWLPERLRLDQGRESSRLEGERKLCKVAELLLHPIHLYLYNREPRSDPNEVLPLFSPVDRSRY